MLFAGLLQLSELIIQLFVCALIQFCSLTPSLQGLLVQLLTARGMHLVLVYLDGMVQHFLVKRRWRQRTSCIPSGEL